MHIATLDAGGRRVGELALASGPALPAGPVLDLAWSPNGRWLGWWQSSTVAQLVVYDSRANIRQVWPVQAGKLSMTDAGAVMLSDDHLTSYVVGAAPGEPVPATVAGEGLTVGVRTPQTTHFGTVIAGSNGGFVVDDLLPASRRRFVLLPPSGTGSYLGEAAPAAPAAPPWGAAAVSPDGAALAVERGDHTDGCGVPPPSVLTLVDLRSGTLREVPLPAARPGGVARVQSLTWSPTGVLGAVLVDCGGATPYPTGFSELVGSSWRQVRDDTAAGARGPGGLLALSAGRYAGGAEGFDVVGSRQLTVQGLAGAATTLGTATELVWSPITAG